MRSWDGGCLLHNGWEGIGKNKGRLQIWGNRVGGTIFISASFSRLNN
ncbi:hypothetical protein LINPERPRIM_LOCUS23172 [Linum perenne]